MQATATAIVFAFRGRVFTNAEVGSAVGKVPVDGVPESRRLFVVEALDENIALLNFEKIEYVKEKRIQITSFLKNASSPQENKNDVTHLHSGFYKIKVLGRRRLQGACARKAHR